MSLFFKGLLVGFAIAMPIGKIGVLCIRHALSKGFGHGFIAGFGAACANAVLGAIAAFTLAFATMVFGTWQLIFQVIGGLLLLCLGTIMFFSRPEREIRKKETCKTAISLFGMTFSLNLGNPWTILGYAAIYAALEQDLIVKGIHPALTLTVAIFVGAMLWWMILSFSVSFYGKRWHIQSVHWLNWISGAILLIFGLWAVRPIFFAFLSLIHSCS